MYKIKPCHSMFDAHRPLAIEDAKKSLQWDLDYLQIRLWGNHSPEKHVDA